MRGGSSSLVRMAWTTILTIYFEMKTCNNEICQTAFRLIGALGIYFSEFACVNH